MIDEILGAIGAIKAGPAPDICPKKTVNGITVSTVMSIDKGAETALIDSNGVYPVERYLTEEEAIEGHEKWINDIDKGLLTVKMIPYSDEEEEIIELESVEDDD